MGIVVAVDGPAGSGKSTVSRELARRRGLAYLDTGATYRAATWWAMRENADLDDQDGVARIVEAMPLETPLDPDSQPIVCAGQDITSEIRGAGVSAVVSKIATNLQVRKILGDLQRAIIAGEREKSAGIVAEGRDITTVVAPDADLRVLLTASEEARLARRARELSDDAESLERIRDLVVRRDRDDATVSEFMRAADGVVEIDSSALTIDEVVAAIEQLIDEREER